LSFASALLVSSLAVTASAQLGGQLGGQYGPYGGQYGGQYYPQAPPPPPRSFRPKSTALEIGYLYVTAAAYGVGTGIWFDALAGIDDPGLQFIAPGVLGVAAPVGVFFLDSPPMPRGMPSAIATGMIVGAGEGLGVASYQFVTARSENEWPFLGLASSEVIGSTVGGAAGYAFYYFFRPSPKTNIFIASGAFWGSVIGSEFGGGASNGDWDEANDTISLGGLIGFNVAVAGAVGLSTVWTPSWNQIGWMWGGMAIGTAVSLPVYIFYAGSDYDPRRGLIFQGVAGLLGVGAGALIGSPDRKGAVVWNEEEERPAFARVLGGSLVPYKGGLGAQVYGELW
jgi:hypothetical protein